MYDSDEFYECCTYFVPGCGIRFPPVLFTKPDDRPDLPVDDASSGPGNVYLFNIDDDPYEMYNLVKDRSDMVIQMLQRLAYFNSE